MKFSHEDHIICFSEISMVIPTELIIAIDVVADAAHHPLDRVQWTNSIGITIHDSDWCEIDVLYWNICSDTVLFTL